MKLFRYGDKGAEKPGILLDDKHFDVSLFGEDYTNDFIATGGLQRLAEFIAKDKNSLSEIPYDARLGTPVANPRKIVCAGLNYTDHVAETGFTQESEPILFMKAISALNGPYDGVTIPKGSLETDWETELGLIIAKEGTNLAKEEAQDYIAGYVLINDISERSYMKKRGGTWDKGKGCNTFAPVGPYLVTKDEISDVYNLNIWLKLNGQLMQQGNTKNLIYDIDTLLAYISEFFGLFPGDIISTGSPAGTGIGQNPQRFLRDGDLIEYGIDGLGQGRQLFTAFENR